MEGLAGHHAEGHRCDAVEVALKSVGDGEHGWARWGAFQSRSLFSEPRNSVHETTEILSAMILILNQKSMHVLTVKGLT